MKSEKFVGLDVHKNFPTQPRWGNRLPAYLTSRRFTTRAAIVAGSEAGGNPMQGMGWPTLHLP